MVFTWLIKGLRSDTDKQSDFTVLILCLLFLSYGSTVLKLKMHEMCHVGELFKKVDSRRVFKFNDILLN